MYRKSGNKTISKKGRSPRKRQLSNCPSNQKSLLSSRHLVNQFTRNTTGTGFAAPCITPETLRIPQKSLNGPQSITVWRMKGLQAGLRLGLQLNLVASVRRHQICSVGDCLWVD